MHFRPWPRTLLWRSFLLISLLLGASLFAWMQIYQQFALKPRSEQISRLVVSVVNLTRAALIAADAGQRLALLRDLRHEEGIRVLPAETDDETTALPDNEAMLLLEQRVRARLGGYTRFAARLNDQPGFFVSFRVDEQDEQDEYWLMLPSERVERASAAQWLGWGLVAVLASLLGAYLLVLGIARPLKALERGARAIGRGERPGPLPEQGAQEIVAVAQAFEQMSDDLAQLDSDRALILAGVSHDLRTPLARLRLGIEMSGAPRADIRRTARGYRSDG
ncbi:HAMP domain-containing protein [Candidatus Dactylopiibacterium carminicum]|uniref:HAMP domain-containing protein n=1 Tax=Candidatus Dactylopiibacterium carminicum TaxID=857335 RepID=UPI001CC31289|nr:HAMP domain-containing protein [Candidatus Dactylopiibacterium carminicum]